MYLPKKKMHCKIEIQKQSCLSFCITTITISQKKVVRLSLNIYNCLPMDARLYVFYPVCFQLVIWPSGQLPFSGNADEFTSLVESALSGLCGLVVLIRDWWLPSQYRRWTPAFASFRELQICISNPEVFYVVGVTISKLHSQQNIYLVKMASGNALRWPPD